jgi:hypothetical protein
METSKKTRMHMKKEIQNVSTFHYLLVLRDKVSKMSTWGFNTGLRFRLIVTGLTPLVVGSLIQIRFDLLISR